MIRDGYTLVKHMRTAFRKTKLFKGTAQNHYVKFNYEIYGVSHDDWNGRLKLNVRVTDGKYFSRFNKEHTIKMGTGWRTTRSTNYDVRECINSEWKSFICNTFGIYEYDLSIGTIKIID